MSIICVDVVVGVFLSFLVFVVVLSVFSFLWNWFLGVVILVREGMICWNVVEMIVVVLFVDFF